MEISIICNKILCMYSFFTKTSYFTSFYLVECVMIKVIQSKDRNTIWVFIMQQLKSNISNVNALCYI